MCSGTSANLRSGQIIPKRQWRNQGEPHKGLLISFFVINIFYLFSHTSQHNIHSKQTKHNKTTNVYSLFQKSKQKGEREGDKKNNKKKQQVIPLYNHVY